MDYSTTSYTQETPAWLWDVWKTGPGADYDRFDQRLTQLIAVDVLANCPGELDDSQEQAAVEFASEVAFADV